jgi:hypothetical protein
VAIVSDETENWVDEEELVAPDEMDTEVLLVELVVVDAVVVEFLLEVVVVVLEVLVTEVVVAVDELPEFPFMTET